ncbi:hypothetical protein [Bacteroides sp.]|uniref:hypothetical protein n=1 Tax=Bacteroides sp. TaxID=29523 RepID=UPI003AB8C3DF
MGTKVFLCGVSGGIPGVGIPDKDVNISDIGAEMLLWFSSVDVICRMEHSRLTPKVLPPNDRNIVAFHLEYLLLACIRCHLEQYKMPSCVA